MISYYNIKKESLWTLSFKFIQQEWSRHVTCVGEKAGFEPGTLGSQAERLTTALLAGIMVPWTYDIIAKFM